MDAQKTVIRPATVAEALPILELAEKYDAQEMGLAKLLQNCQLFILDGSDSQMAYAVIPQGQELWIQAGAGRGAVDLTELGLASIEMQAVGFKSVGFQTRRRGLVKKAIALGYQIDGYILRKKL